MRYSITGLCVVVVILGHAARVRAQNPCTDFVGAVTKVQSGGREGAGVVVGVNATSIAVVTAAHVVDGTGSVDVTFHGLPNRKFPASRVLATPVNEDDLAVVTTTVDAETLKSVAPPYLVIRPSADVEVGERVTTIGHVSDTDWKCVAQVNSITALARGTDARFFTSTPSGIGDGNSGGPLFDRFGQIMGITTRSGKGLGGDIISTKIEGVLALVRRADITPNRLGDKRPVDTTGTGLDLKAIADRDGVDAAQKFLELLARNQMSQAYAMFSPTVRSAFSLAQFVTWYTQYTAGMAGRQLKRQLSTSVRMSAFPGPTGPVNAETFVLTFSTVDATQPGPTVFEIVTVAREDNRWNVVGFVWNTVAAASATPSESTPSEPEPLARQILSMMYQNELSTVYRRFVSDLQKRTSLTTEGAFVSLCSVALGPFPGKPASLTLIASRRYDSLPQFFGEYKGDFLMLVFLAQYTAGNVNQELYLVRESGAWKIAGFMVRPAGGTGSVGAERTDAAGARSQSSPLGVGNWYAGRLESTWSSSDCGSTSWTERRLTLTPVPGQPGRVRGEWAMSYSRIWMKHDAMRCRWPGQIPQDDFASMQFAVNGFEVTGEATGSGSVKIHGRFVSCAGNGCTVFYPNGRQNDFDTELSVTADGLVDTNATSTPDDDVVFQSRDADARAQAEISAAVRPLLEMLDRDDVTSFYASATTDNFRANTSREQLAQGLKVLHARATIVSRDVFRCIVASNAQQFSKAPGQFALLINNAYLSGNRNSLEFVFLTNVNGQWRINQVFWS